MIQISCYAAEIYNLLLVDISVNNNNNKKPEIHILQTEIDNNAT